MDDNKLEKLLASKNENEITNILEEFNQKNADIFKFESLHTEEEWRKLWSAVFKILSDSELYTVHSFCLNTIRILTRDERSLSKHDLGDDISILLSVAQLTTDETSFNDADTIIVVDALKCLCNLAYQNADCRRKCVKKNALDAILKRVASPIQFPSAVELFDMKFLFLLTALHVEARSKVQIDLNGVAYMTEWLDEKLNETPDRAFVDEELDVLAEILKVMFNITTSPDKSPNENEIQNMHLTGVIRDVLYCFGNLNNEREFSIVGHAINLLTNISGSCLSELLIKLDPTLATSSKLANKMIPFEERNVYALDVMMRYLKRALDEHQNTASSSEFLVPPALAVLIKCSRGHPIMRHYIRSIILPPLRDASHRPEVGNEVRNYLCRFLTQPADVLRDLSSELLFTLCKENVRRMVKYTGYGNAAGLFARRGLLDCRRVETAQYSSDSESSDTEEYKEQASGINPVLGCVEPPKKDPFEGMSEEQKEYEAEQLANLMDKLHKSGIVQPCRIGVDGKPVPVDHILQLQEELPQQQVDKKQKS